eukprot:4868180-Prymnesium_polylepis.1
MDRSMRSTEFGFAVFVCLFAAALIMDSISLRQSEVLEALGLAFDLPLHVSFFWSFATAVSCASVHAVSATRAAEGVPLMVLLIVLHTAAYISNAINPPPAGKGRVLEFAKMHGWATLAALVLAFLYKTARTLAKIYRWNSLLKRVERQAQQQQTDDAAGDALPLTSRGPVLLL